MSSPTVSRQPGFVELLFHTGAAVVTWFVPPDIRGGPEEARRARLVVVSGLVAAMLCAILLVLVPWGPWVRYGDLILPRPVVGGLALSVIMFVSAAYVVRRTRAARSAAFLLATSLSVMVSFLAYFSGGLTSPILWWMVAMPLFSSLVTGPKGAVNMAIISTSLLLYFYLLHTAGHPFPMVHGADEGRQLRGQFFLLAFITILAWYYERDRIAHMRHLTDATARAEATHRALQYSQAHVRQIAENIGQALWMYDMSSKRVVYANSGFERLWDMPRSRLAKNPRAWVARVHPEDLDFVPARADAHDHAYRIMLDDGQERWIRHAVYPVDAGEAEVQRVIHIAADITLKQTAEMMREQFIETVLEVQETERKHLARELHDETGQALTALLVGLKALDGTLKDAAQQEHVRLLRHQLRDVINDIGRLARGLHPAVLDEHGLKAAVTRLVNDLSDAHRIRGNVRTEGFSPGTEELIPRDARLTVYRICQEALTNVIRHAQATEFDVTLTLDDDNLYLRVEDDGKGFAPGDERSGSREIGLGMGMLSMRERAAMTGGQVLVESAPGMGTTVQVELPLFPRMSTAEARRAAFLNRDT